MTPRLLPEEDAIDDLDDDEADLTLPGDLWFRSRRASESKEASYTADWPLPGRIWIWRGRM